MCYKFLQEIFRYGEIFKTHLLGCPCIMLASPEASRLVLTTQAHLFKPTYPKSKESLIGPSALFFHQGDYHARLRKLVQSSLSPEAIRDLVSSIGAVATSALDSWASTHVISTFAEMKKVGLRCLLFFGVRFIMQIDCVCFFFTCFYQRGHLIFAVFS